MSNRLNCKEYYFSSHAVQRMFERKINKNSVISAIKEGEVIADYPDDKPYPSCLILYFVKSKPIHAVVALDIAEEKCYIITVYIPSIKIWHEDFKTRRDK